MRRAGLDQQRPAGFVVVGQLRNGGILRPADVIQPRDIPEFRIAEEIADRAAVRADRDRFAGIRLCNAGHRVRHALIDMRHRLAVRCLKIPDVFLPYLKLRREFFAQIGNGNALPVAAVDLMQIVFGGQREPVVFVDRLRSLERALPRAVIDRIQRDIAKACGQIRDLLTALFGQLRIDRALKIRQDIALRFAVAEQIDGWHHGFTRPGSSAAVAM